MHRIGVIVTLFLPELLAAQQPLAVQRGVSVRPDTVTIGEPFRVHLRIRASSGATIAFPDGPDTLAAVEALDPRVVSEADIPDAVEQTAIYRLAAWDVGSQPLRLGDVTVRRGGDVRSIPLGELSVFVRSVLPADSAQRVPKPARDLLLDGFPWWLLWLALLLAAALTGLGLWWWYRRRRTRHTVRIDPFAHAEREFRRIEALGLLEAGERGRFIALMVEVLREYLAARFPVVAPVSLTSSELLVAARELRAVPLARLAVLLEEADLIKFARHSISPEHARELGREARQLVRETEEAERVPPAEVPLETAA